MPLVKNAHAAPLIKDALVLDLGDLQRQADAIIHDAHARAQVIIDDAKVDAEAMHGRAREEGYQEGFKEGLAEGQTAGAALGREELFTDLRPRLETLAENWGSALDDLATRRDELIDDAHADTLLFAIHLAERLTHRTIQHDPAVAVDQVAGALGLLLSQSHITVCVHPTDHELVAEALPQLVESIGRCEHASLREDPAIEPGGCVLLTANGRIDATLATQLQRVAEILLPARSHEPAGNSPQASEHDGVD